MRAAEYLGGKVGRADGKDGVRGEEILHFITDVGEAFQQHDMLAAEAGLLFTTRVKMEMPMYRRKALAEGCEWMRKDMLSNNITIRKKRKSAGCLLPLRQKL